jgi:hypothetical protein
LRTLESTSLMIHYLSIFDPLSLLPRYSNFPKPVHQESDFLHVIRGGSGALELGIFFVGKQFFLACKSFLEAALRHSRFLPSVSSVNTTERDDDSFSHSSCTLAYNSWARFPWTNFRFHRPIRSLTTSAVKFLSFGQVWRGVLAP